MPRASRRSAADRTIRALRTTGRLEAVDEALIDLVRSLADALDRMDPTERNFPPLSNQYARVLRELRGESRDTDDADALLARLTSSGETSIRDG